MIYLMGKHIGRLIKVGIAKEAVSGAGPLIWSGLGTVVGTHDG